MKKIEMYKIHLEVLICQISMISYNINFEKELKKQDWPAERSLWIGTSLGMQ